MQISKSFWLIFVAAALAFGAPVAFVPSAHAGNGTAVGVVNLDTVDSASLGDYDVDDDVDPAKAIGIKLKAKKGVKTLAYALIEYNTSSCAFIDSGTWKVSKKPKAGNTSTGLLSGNLNSGDHCNGTHFSNFGAIYYTATKPKKKDAFAASWSTSDHNFDLHFSFKVKITK